MPSASFHEGSSSFDLKFMGSKGAQTLTEGHQFYMRIEEGPGHTGSREFHRGSTISTHVSNFVIELRKVQGTQLGLRGAGPPF